MWLNVNSFGSLELRVPPHVGSTKGVRCEREESLALGRVFRKMQQEADGRPASQALLRVGLVGCSWFALRAHVPALEKIPGCKLVAVCSRTRKSMAKAEAKIGREVKRHAKMEQMFADEEVDVVLLVLPIPLMPEAVEKALRAGKHVISEKPAAPTVEAALHLHDVLHQLGPDAPRWLVVENWSAAKPSVRYMRERLQEGTIGAIVSVHCAYDHAAVSSAGGGGGGGGGGRGQRAEKGTGAGTASSSWRGDPDAGGWLVDVGVHWARALRVLLGEATLCSAHIDGGSSSGSMHAWAKFEHCASAATLQLSYGSRMHTSLSASAPPALRITGEKGSLCWWPCGKAGASRPSLGPLPAGAGGDGKQRACVTMELAGSGDVHTHSIDDDWVEGGVEPTLTSVLHHLQCCKTPGGDGGGGDAKALVAAADAAAPGCFRLGSDEAVRDLAFVHALLRSHRRGRPIDPSALLALPSERTREPPEGACEGDEANNGDEAGVGERGGGKGHAAHAASFGLVRIPPTTIWDVSGTWSFIPDEEVSCATEAEVVSAMALAAARGVPVRPLGTSHSWSRYGAADHGLCVRMAGMDRVLHVDARAHLVRVEAGCTLRELRRVLAAHSLTLGSYPMLLDQTVGGAVLGCGSHGSAPREGTLADAVIALRLVTRDGSVRELTDEGVGAQHETESADANDANDANGDDGGRPSEEQMGPSISLRDARVSLGAAGIATSLTLRCEPCYYVRRHVHVLHVAELRERLEALCDAYRHLWMWWALGDESICACGLEDMGSAPAHGAAIYDGENWYRGAPPLEAPGAARRRREAGAVRPGAGGDGELNGSTVRSYSMQYALPRSRLGDLLGALADSASSIGLGRVVELKLVGGDGKSRLGVNAEGPVVCANALWRLAPTELCHLEAFESALVAIGARPHWGKLHFSTSAGDRE